MGRRISWLKEAEVLAIHDQQLLNYGGMPGLRDSGLLQSALANPPTAYGYGVIDLAELAAKLAFRLISNHPFFDGNKRTALVASVVFLHLNKRSFNAPEAQMVNAMINVATGEMTEEDLVGFYQKFTSP
jgi:death on curing protein